jgi:tetratricopeptide (TPR) repeat protein
MKKFLVLVILCSLVILQTSPVLSAQNNSAVEQYAEIAHTAYNKSDYLKAAQYYEKAYAIEKNKVFLDNAITAYLSYAFKVADEKQYTNAIKYCQKILSYRATDKNTKELLSDIYLARGSDFLYAGDSEKAKSDFQNALKYSVLPEQAQKAKEGLAELKNTVGNKQNAGFKEVRAYAPEAMPDVLKLLELKIYGKTQEAAPLLSRIQKLEKDVFNKNYNDDTLVNRLDRIKKAALPELAQKPVNNTLQKDYIPEIIEQSNGTARIFGEMPILIYFDDSTTKIYKRYYVESVKEAMKEWETASNGKIKFEISNNPMRSHLKIVWTDYFEDFAWRPELKKEDVAAQKQQLKYGKANSLVQMGSVAAMVLGAVTGVPILGMAGSIGGSVASPILQYKSLDLNDRTLNVKINTDCTVGMTKEESSAKIKQIALHQLGHSIGIYGHSPNSNDIMYENFSINKISERDKNTIIEIYKNVEIKKDDKSLKKRILGS